MENVKNEIPHELPMYAKVEDLARGIKAWSNPQNGFRVVELHFEADPKKRTPEYEIEVHKGISHAQFLREYHLVWRSFQGRPVYMDDWNRNTHVSKELLRFAPHLPVIRGWDFGVGGSACVFAQLMPEMRLYVLHEICEEGIGVEKLLEEVKLKSMEWFPNAKRFLDVVDPAGFARSPTDERSCVLVMSQHPWFLKPIPGIQNPVARRSAVIKFLQRNVRGQMAFVISQSCKMLVGGFDGGYHFAHNKSGQLRENPEKNDYSHSHDALQYICTRIFDIDTSAVEYGNIKIAQPSYSQMAMRA